MLLSKSTMSLPKSRIYCLPEVGNMHAVVNYHPGAHELPGKHATRACSRIVHRTQLSYTCHHHRHDVLFMRPDQTSTCLQQITSTWCMYTPYKSHTSCDQTKRAPASNRLHQLGACTLLITHTSRFAALAPQATAYACCSL